MTEFATEIVINAPDLQSPAQRLSTAILLGMGWLLWAYFAFPFVELCGWFMDIRICSEWVNLSGGYLSLQHLLVLYGLTVAGWLGLWSLWVMYRSLRHRRRRGALPAVALEPICRDFGVEPAQVAQCRASRVTTVHFDGNGRIVGMEAR